MRWLLALGAATLIGVFVRPLELAASLIAAGVMLIGIAMMLGEGVAAVIDRSRGAPTRAVSVSSDGQRSSTTEVRVPYRALVLPGVWARVRMLSEMPRAEALRSVEKLATNRLTVSRSIGGFRLRAKGPRQGFGEYAWTPDIVVVGTIRAGETGSVVELEVRPPRSWEIGYLFLDVFIAALIAFFVVALVFERGPALGWATVTLVGFVIVGIAAVAELRALASVLDSVVGQLRFALRSKSDIVVR